jgi:phosphopantetheinyl transferase
VEIAIASDDRGRPLVSSRLADDVRVSIAHKDGVAVAIAALGGDPGIDIETIGAHDDGFEGLAFGEDELALLPPRDRDEWLTRLWCAKEAAVKARGTGFEGLPRRIAATAIDGERFVVEGRLVETRRDGVTIIAWTLP